MSDTGARVLSMIILGVCRARWGCRRMKWGDDRVNKNKCCSNAVAVLGEVCR